MDQPRIRPIAICLFRRHDRILVFEGYDRVKAECFYRPLGGGIEFGETSAQAVVREIREELGAEVAEVRYLFTLENIFIHDGRPGHEIIQVYDGRFVDERWYARAELAGREDSGQPFTALWKTVSDFGPGRAILYPSGLWERLQPGQAAGL